MTDDLVLEAKFRPAAGTAPLNGLLRRANRRDELHISEASGITADREGNVHAAEVGP